jgi:hypothetical protein
MLTQIPKSMTSLTAILPVVISRHTCIWFYAFAVASFSTHNRFKRINAKITSRIYFLTSITGLYCCNGFQYWYSMSNAVTYILCSVKENEYHICFDESSSFLKFHSPKWLFVLTRRLYSCHVLSEKRLPQLVTEACNLRAHFTFRCFWNIYLRYLRSKRGERNQCIVFAKIKVVPDDTLLAETLLAMPEQINNTSRYPYNTAPKRKHSLTLRIPISFRE